MWLTPWASSRSRTPSARSWRIEDRAAAPKMTRLESWPVRPNGAVAIMGPRLRIEPAHRQRPAQRGPQHLDLLADPHPVDVAPGRDREPGVRPAPGRHDGAVDQDPAGQAVEEAATDARPGLPPGDPGRGRRHDRGRVRVQPGVEERQGPPPPPRRRAPPGG